MWFFFRVPISLVKFNICSPTWSIFSSQFFNVLILIVVTLKFLLANFSLWVFCGFVSIGCLLPSGLGVTFSSFSFFLLYFGHTMKLMGSQFPDQGLNLGHISDIES